MVLNKELYNSKICYFYLILECYVVENGIQTATESEIAKTFHKYYDDFNTCTQNADAETLCNSCTDDYVILKNFFESISNANERIGVCIDLEDLVSKDRLDPKNIFFNEYAHCFR